MAKEAVYVPRPALRYLSSMTELTFGELMSTYLPEESISFSLVDIDITSLYL